MNKISAFCFMKEQNSKGIGMRNLDAFRVPINEFRDL